MKKKIKKILFNSSKNLKNKSLDCFFKFYLFTQSVNIFMLNGKRTLYLKLFFSLFSQIKLFYKITPLFFLTKLLFFFRNPIDIRYIKKAGRLTYYPYISKLFRQYIYFFTIFKKSVLQNTDQFFSDKLLSEFLNLLFFKRGLTYKKYISLLTIAFENRTVLHYRKSWR